jgi:heavy metal sensor kinase
LNRFSISLRLTVWFTAVFVCGFVIFGIVMWAELADSLARGRDRTLTRRAARALEVFAATPPDDAGLRTARYRDFAEGTPESELIRVYNSAGDLLYPEVSDAPPGFPWPKPAWIQAPHFSDVMFQGGKYRVLESPAVLPSEDLLIVVGGQLQDNRQLLDHFSAGLWAAIPVLLAASALAGYFTTRRVLAPVDRITAAVRSISIGNLSERLPIRHTGDELERLAETCNEMLARLEAAVAEIKRFTADASHELRSPLSYISMVAEEALRHPESRPEDRESFEGILAESYEATSLLENMLLIARADAGHVDIPFEHIDLTALVKEVFERARIAAEAKGHRVSLDCSGGTCEIRGNRSSLQRLIWALLDNAIKYTPEGGRVDVRLRPDGTHASLAVHDTGIGIAAALLPRVFERFFRADPARSQGGTGLGLAIAKWIADVHHAKLSVESELGAGSTFTVVFPLESQAGAVLRPAS